MNKKTLTPVGNQLFFTEHNSVQPNVLVRTPLFSPVSQHAKRDVENDVTDDLRELEFFKREGYEVIKIIGVPLSVQTDFKVWCAIMLAFSNYGYTSGTITLRFTEFVKMCGFNPKDINHRLRVRIDESLQRIKRQTITFQRKDAKKSTHTGLVHRASFDADADIIELIADPELWELYILDHKILVSIKILQELPRSEVAQSLYLFMSSLPNNPVPVSLSRLRQRVNLRMVNKEANRRIKTAIKKLESIGYLTGYWTEFHGETAYQITGRAALGDELLQGKDTHE